MLSHKNTGRVVGLLLLLVFALGVITFQVLQSPVLSGSANVAGVVSHDTQLILSAFISLLGGSLSILVAVLLLPVFRKRSETLAIAYLAFAIVNFVAIAMDTVSVLSILELGRLVITDGGASAGISEEMTSLLYKRQWWTHHLYLLISCVPVLLLYSGLFVTRTVPRALALFGVVAAVAMAIEMIGVMLGSGLSDMLFIPIALVQLATPLWLLARGLNGDQRRNASMSG